MFHKKIQALTFILLMLSVYKSNAQILIPLNKEWISKNSDYIKLNGTHIFFQFNDYYQEKGYHIYGDTLRMQDWYHSSADNYKKLQNDDFDFLIKKSENKITLYPINSNALKMSKHFIEFTPIENIYLNKFTYQSIKFTSTTCYGECPEMTIIIEGKKVLFIGGINAIKQGKYVAVLSEDLHRTLLSILKKSSFKNLRNSRGVVIDAPHYSISIKNHNISKTISGENLPIQLYPLRDFLLSLPRALEKRLILYK